ncbi:MAG TPA: YciI-like protein [Anaeromyxobacter sp.]|nr:YciI-like protein [Anaeromyxobacter sp.]
MYFALFYEYVPDMLERRVAHRDAHLALVRKLHAEGRIALAGAFAPVDGALIVIRADTPAQVEAFVKEDPYVQHGLVTRWRIREWSVVVGG